MSPRYRGTLAEDERKELEAFNPNSKTPAKMLTNTLALLLCAAIENDPAWKIADISSAPGITSRALDHLKKRFVEEGISVALVGKPRDKQPRREVVFAGAFLGGLTALVCWETSPRYRRWTV